ncbi:MAG: PAS domain S-box protein [Marinobacter sp.]
MTATCGYPKAEDHDRLRRSAEALIQRGAMPRGSGGALGVDALTLLYQRASNPESAADALKILHELKTHQVELDLLYEQLQANEQDITEELTHYKSLYENAPAAYLMVANDGQIVEGNHAAGALFGESAMVLAGKALCDFLAPGQGDVVNRLLGNVGKQAQGLETTLVKLMDGRCMAVRVTLTAAGDSTMMILTGITAVPEKF